MLSAREIPSQGGETEYVSMRAVYAALPESDKAAIEELVTIHDYAFGRCRIAPELVTDEEGQRWSDPQVLRSLLEEVERELLPHLLEAP